MRVHHLNCGTLRPLGGGLIDGRPGLFRRATMVCHCLLLETDTGLVLVETGMGTPAAVDRNAWLGAGFVRQSNPVEDPAQTAIAQIRALGFDPADVRDIVLTHLDLDHAGGLIDFPWARVHVYAEELRAFQEPRDAVERGRYRTIQFAHGPQWTSYADSGEPWFGFDAVACGRRSCWSRSPATRAATRASPSTPVTAGCSTPATRTSSTDRSTPPRAARPA
jgi:glyoxylase-like metal-dependent hydrolase (beta-lactamase superfamily II)